MNSVAIFSLFCGLLNIVNGYATTTTKDCAATVSANPPDPESGCCGVDDSFGNKIIGLGGTHTAIDQYPWVALIEYDKEGKIHTSCGGTLISGRFVLTAAHCVTGNALLVGKPTNVRLGEYDTSHDGPDCETVVNGGQDCTGGVVRIPIEKIVAHPEYDTKVTKRHDIALIRMKELAPYTDFIRPICLPTKDISSGPVNFILAGWGTSYGPSPVKVHLGLPLVAKDKCQLAYSSKGRNFVTLGKEQICAGGEKGKDSCKGDGGMPLMYENDKKYEAAGIVSFGPAPCGQEGIPSVYTNIYEYLPWIKSIITEN